MAEVDLSAEQISRLDEHFSHRDYHTVYLGANGAKANRIILLALRRCRSSYTRCFQRISDQSFGSLQHIASEQKSLGTSSVYVGSQATLLQTQAVAISFIILV